MSTAEQETALKEAKILEMLKHPNIVAFREVYRTTRMKLNIVMEYAGGGDLSHRVKAAKETKNHFSETNILNWFVQICLAIRYIHSKYVSLNAAKSFTGTSKPRMFSSLRRDSSNWGTSG